MKQLYQPEKVNQIDSRDENRCALEIYAQKEDVQKVEKQILNQVRGQVSHPGFRKGKAPDRILMSQYGPNIKERVVQMMVPALIEQAVKEEGWQKSVIGPRVDQIHYELGEAILSFSVSFDRQPKVEIKSFEELQLKATKKVKQITDKDVDQVIAEIRNRQGNMKVKDTFLIEKGDFCVCDVKITASDSKVLLHKKSERYPVADNPSIPAFVEKLSEVNQGEELQYEAELSDQYEADFYRGQKVSVCLTVHDVLTWELPELTDEWAKDLGQYESLEQFKEFIKKDIEQREFQQSEANVQSEVVKLFVDAHECHIPEVMVNQFKEDIMASRYQEIKKYGLNKDQEIEYLKSIEGQVLEQATFLAKRSIVFEELIEVQKIQLTEKEENSYLEKAAQREKKSKESLLKELTNEGKIEQVRDQLLFEKVVAFLVDQADIQEEELIEEGADQDENEANTQTVSEGQSVKEEGIK